MHALPCRRVHIAHQSLVELLVYGSVHPHAKPSFWVGLIHPSGLLCKIGTGHRATLPPHVLCCGQSYEHNMAWMFTVCEEDPKLAFLLAFEALPAIQAKISHEGTTMKTFGGLLLSSVSIICCTFTFGKVQTLHLEVCPATWSTFVLLFV